MENDVFSAPRDTARAMSQENVNRFVELTEAFNRLNRTMDRSDMDSWIEFYDPEVHFEPQQAALQGSYVGHEGLREWLADIAEHYIPGAHLHYRDIRDLGDRVLALGTLLYTGKGSGIQTEAAVAILASFRNGLIIDLKDYGDKDKALEAAGLSE
jgi:ketosteroid isomerase-like protein